MFPEPQKKVFGPYGPDSLYADPLRVYRRLQVQLDGDANKYLEQAESPDPSLAFQAKERLIPATIFAFELTPFDPQTGKGALEEEVVSLLNSYLEFMDSKKESGQTLRTCSLPSQVSAPAR